MFTLTWASAAVNGLPSSSRASFDLMSTFIRVFPVVPAPALYLSLGALLLDSTALPRAFARLALFLGAWIAPALRCRAAKSHPGVHPPPWLRRPLTIGSPHALTSVVQPSSRLITFVGRPSVGLM